MSYKPKFERLFRQWQMHDLAQYRPPFYEGLEPNDEIVVWEFIEQKYLLKYQSLVKLEFDWSSTGLWRLPFPGSVQIGKCLSPESLCLPQDLAMGIADWHRECDMNAKPWEPDDTFDWRTFGKNGLALAKRLKLHLGDAVYVEYHPFQELMIIEGEVGETDVPELIRKVVGAQSA